MKPRHYLILAFLFAASTAQAVVTRSGVPDSLYVVRDGALPALADLPLEGHGVLIAKRWVVTVAHAVRMMQAMPQKDDVTIAGKRRKVVRIVLYPGYVASASQWNRLLKHMKTEDVAVWMGQYAFFRGGMHDIALIELSQPVDDVKPMELYRGSDESGQVAKILGKGATGNMLTGAAADASHRTRLRRAYNRIVEAKGQWLYYTLDCGHRALPLEGVIGGGDSGGPVLIQDGGTWKLAGLAQGLGGQKSDLLAMRAGKFRMGVCGQDFSSSRISYYVRWIEDTIAGP